MPAGFFFAYHHYLTGHAIHAWQLCHSVSCENSLVIPSLEYQITALQKDKAPNTEKQDDRTYKAFP